MRSIRADDQGMRFRVYVWAALLVVLAAPDGAQCGVRGRRATSGGISSRPASRPMGFGARAPRPEPVYIPEVPPRIAIRFTSVPAGADVLIDGEFWGTTPTAAFTILPEGTHTVVVKKSGYVTWEQSITIGSDDKRTVVVELVAKQYDPTKPWIVGN